MNNKNFSKNTAGKIIIAILLIMLIAAGAVIAWILTHEKEDEPAIDPAVVVIKDDNATAEPVDGIQIPGYPELTADSSGVIQNIFQNPAGNSCYFKLELIREDNGETLWASGWIPPGNAIVHPTLTTVPASGTYNAVLKYQTLGVEDKKAENGAELKTQLIIQ